MNRAIRRIASACGLRLGKYRVSYFEDAVWTQIEVMAYTRSGAVREVNKLKGLHLRGGYNCFVARIIERR